MNKAIQKNVTLLLVVAILISTSVVVTLPVAATSLTVSDAMNWCESQVGKALDYDGNYGAQCVDFVYYYYQYEDVSVAVNIDGNPGVWGMDVKISYDRSAMTLISVENGGFFQDSEWIRGNLSASTYTLSYEASGFDNVTTFAGTLAILHFKLNVDAASGTYEIGGGVSSRRHHQCFL